MRPPPPGMEMLIGAADGHVHACPHINGRRLDVFEAVREAAAAGMAGLGLMDNFANSSGIAALAMRELSHLDIDVWGGLIMEPPAGGVSGEAVRIALAYGYGPGTGARFVSLPTHHTRHTARQEGRSPAYVESCFHASGSGPLPDPLPEILDLAAAHDVVFNLGHVDETEAVRLAEAAKARGVARVLAPANHASADAVRALVAAGAMVEFSFFFVSHATAIGLTHVDAEKHRIAAASVHEMVERIRAAPPDRVVLSSDCGVYLLPPPVEGLREFVLLLEAAGLARETLQPMIRENPKRLFRVNAPSGARTP
jgi:Family of unknown function (DUF6282)